MLSDVHGCLLECRTLAIAWREKRGWFLEEVNDCGSGCLEVGFELDLDRFVF